MTAAVARCDQLTQAAYRDWHSESECQFLFFLYRIAAFCKEKKPSGQNRRICLDVAGAQCRKGKCRQSIRQSRILLYLDIAFIFF